MVTKFLPHWKDLPLDAQKQFQQSAKIIEKKRGETVYRVGDNPKGLYIVEKGLVGLMLLGLSGKQGGRTIEILDREALLDLEDQEDS